MATQKNIFISHVHEDDGRLKPLKELLSTVGVEVRDSSINSEKPNDANSPDYIKSGILAPQISWASVLVVLISKGTAESKWVNWEIEYAEKLGKRIVGVWDHGAAGVDVPEALEKYASAVVGWQADKIIGAIDGTINNWETPEGVMASPRDVKRYTC
jgi:hypothetical protein